MATDDEPYDLDPDPAATEKFRPVFAPGPRARPVVIGVPACVPMSFQCVSVAGTVCGMLELYPIDILLLSYCPLEVTMVSGRDPIGTFPVPSTRTVPLNCIVSWTELVPGPIWTAPFAVAMAYAS